MILEKIRQIYPQLTKSQKRLADFIATSYREAAFMTASCLSRRLGLNEATVIRFAQRLGYSGYPQLIQDVQAIVQEELGTGPQSQMPAEQGPLVRLLKAEIENLQRTISHIPAKTAYEAMNMLQEARQVYVLGQGIAAPLAQLFSLSLRALGIPADNSFADPLRLGIVLNDIDERCMLIGISAGMESQQVANALDYAKQKGARTLALTRSPVSPCAQAAELSISCPVDSSFTLPSITPLAMVIDVFIQEIGSQDMESTQNRVEQSGQVRDYILRYPY